MFTKRLTPVSDISADLQKQLVDSYSMPGGWDSKDTPVVLFKEQMKASLFSNQEGKCAYCELTLSTRSPEIEHIAPKGGKKRSKYIECMFLPINLVYSCRRCNSTSCKGNNDIVISKNGTDNYLKWSFSIVHPYIDEPAEYFELYRDNRCKCPIPIPRKDIDEEKRTKAINTIKMFKLDSEEVVLERAKQYFFEEMGPGEVEFIKHISTYLPE